MSSLLKVRVKWGKEKYEGVEVDMNEPPITFKMQLFSLTGVPPDRQKVMIAGTALGDQEWGKIGSKIKPNCTLMLMGSADRLPEAPLEPVRFIEDMTDAELSSAMDISSGLRNLGNTCYMNASIQCLKVVPEFEEKLLQCTTMDSDLVSTQLATSLNFLYQSMNKGSPDLSLLLFLQKLHNIVPHFGERDEKTGVFNQQDAHECWSAIMTNLSASLESVGGAPNSGMTFMEQYFGLRVQTSYNCIEAQDEMESVETEKLFQVSCFIGQDVKYLHTGILKGLAGEIEKTSPSLGREAVYQKKSLISRLPGYLTIQFMRFDFGKAASTDEQVSRKILKDIKYTSKLDMYDFCTPELQSRLQPIRAKYKEVDDTKMALKAKRIAEGPAAAKVKDKMPLRYEQYSFNDDVGSNNSGYYELLAVLTHKGRSSSSGHYLGWVKHSSGHWIKFDDDDVSMVTEEDVLKLSGGGDWHTAYILLYGPRRLEILPQ